MKYSEKLIIAIILFLIVSIVTGSIIGVYVKTKKDNDKANASIILENISQF